LRWTNLARVKPTKRAIIDVIIVIIIFKNIPLEKSNRGLAK
jgi:hypothetical protein